MNVGLIKNQPHGDSRQDRGNVNLLRMANRPLKFYLVWFICFTLALHV